MLLKLFVFASCVHACLVAQSCPILCDPMNCSPPGSSVLRIFQGRITGVGCHFLLQGIFPTQGSNHCLLHCQADSFAAEPPWKPYASQGQLNMLWARGRLWWLCPASKCPVSTSEMQSHFGLFSTAGCNTNGHTNLLIFPEFISSVIWCQDEATVDHRRNMHEIWKANVKHCEIGADASGTCCSHAERLISGSPWTHIPPAPIRSSFSLWDCRSGVCTASW